MKKQLELFTEIISLFSRCILSRRLYYADHPSIENSADAFFERLLRLCRQRGEEQLFIGVFEGHFIFGGHRVFGATQRGKGLLELAALYHCGGFRIGVKLKRDEFRRFLDLTAVVDFKPADLSEARVMLTKKGITAIQLGAEYTNEFGDGSGEVDEWRGEEVGSGGAVGALRLKRQMFDVVSKAIDNAGLDKEVDVRKTRSVSEFMLKHMRNNSMDVLHSVDYPSYENYTVNHSIRVAALVVYTATRMGWSEQILLAVGVAAMLHDVGKCVIPDDVLMKKGRLTPAEFTLIKDHPRAGAEILSRQKDIGPFTLAASWGHHIRFDGGGYPKQAEWAVRHPVSSLLQICDVFEALTAVRPYKDPMIPEKAFTIMMKDKGAFHPELLASFFSFVSFYPPGTRVKLSNGCYGVVTRVNAHPERPLLRILIERGDRALAPGDQYPLDLQADSNRHLEISQLILSEEDILHG